MESMRRFRIYPRPAPAARNVYHHSDEGAVPAFALAPVHPSLQGLLLRLFFVIGCNSTVAPIPEEGFPRADIWRTSYFQWVANLHGYDPRRMPAMHPVAVAMGRICSRLNLFPIGQLDGGHILRATRKYAAPCSYVLWRRRRVRLCFRAVELKLCWRALFHGRHPPTMRTISR